MTNTKLHFVIDKNIKDAALQKAIFKQYKNYTPKKGSSPKLNELDELFEKGELELYSTIENKDIKVEVLDRKCG